MNRLTRYGIVRLLSALLGICVLLLGLGVVYVWGMTCIALDHEAERRASFRVLAQFNASFMRRNRVSQAQYVSELHSFVEKQGPGWYFDEYVRAAEAETQK